MRTRWKESHIKLLIQILKNHEFIWNSKHSKYTRSPKVRQKHWQSVLKVFYDSLKKKVYQPHDVQVKWHNLRCQFHMQYQRYSTEGFGKKRWRYYDMLTFLTGHLVSKRQPAAVVVGRRTYYLRAKVGQSMREDTDEDSKITSMSYQSSTNDEKESNNNTLPKNVTISDPAEKESGDDSYVSIGSISPPYHDDDQETSLSGSGTMSTDGPQSPIGDDKRFEADVAGVCDVDAILQVELNK